MPPNQTIWLVPRPGPVLVMLPHHTYIYTYLILTGPLTSVQVCTYGVCYRDYGKSITNQTCLQGHKELRSTTCITNRLVIQLFLLYLHTDAAQRVIYMVSTVPMYIPPRKLYKPLPWAQLPKAKFQQASKTTQLLCRPPAQPLATQRNNSSAVALQKEKKTQK